MAQVPAATPTGSGVGGLLDSGSGAALQADQQTVSSLLAAIATASATFGAQFLLFYILRWRLTRIYRPKTYLVPERQRIPAPPSGPWQWIKPLFTMPNSTIINKCGLDAYYFLRYLRMLLKIFVPMAIVILPILLPLNRYSGNPARGIAGTNTLGWPNVSPEYVDRTWAHLLLAVGVVFWVCYVVYDELRGYIRIRQAYLTSPQHRIRASATTVLVSGIPRKWLTLEALGGLYDVFPGGIRNIWINRDFDELADKVKLRDKIARQLEDAETVLIKKCVKSHKDAEAKKAKEDGKSLSRKQKRAKREQDDQQAQNIAQGKGISSGNPHQTPKNVHEAADDYEHGGHESDTSSDSDNGHNNKPQLDIRNPMKFVSHGLGALGQGITSLGQKSKNLVGDVVDDVNNGVRTVNNTVDTANSGGGFVVDDSIYAQNQTSVPPPKRTRAEPGVRVVQPDIANDSSRYRPLPEAAAAAPPSTGSAESQQPITGGQAPMRRPTQPPRPANEQPNERPPGIKGLKSRVVAYKHANAIPCPSPEPHNMDPLDYPLQDLGQGGREGQKRETRVAKSKWAEAWSKTQFWTKTGDELEIEYPTAFVQEYSEDQDGEPEWMQYITVKDRETIRLPIASWMFSLPLIGQKVDRIYHLRRELARLNAEIEIDQDDVERFPLMTSAFIQFNHQIAAHMACQSVNHHIPQFMAPRLVEISPNDIIWSNMSIKWWERYVRTGLVVAACVALIIFFAIPVGFTGLVSNVDQLSRDYPWLAWLADLPTVVIAIISGVLPPVLLAALLAIVPMIFRFLVQLMGVATGNDKELGVQKFYFAFLFFQVFLVVTLTSGLTNLLANFAENTTDVLLQIARDLPGASNYFYTYLIVQALGQSAGALLQIGTLIFWFILGPILDSTARQKWTRQTNLSTIQWGSYHAPFTNFAVIGMAFSIISPLIMVFNLITFSLFLVVQKYNVMYVYLFKSDTGGLLFPQAVNQLFTGLYVMEISLAGLFFVALDINGTNVGVPQGVIMVIMVAFTATFQVLLNSAFAPLLRYLPITLEDEAVMRDEEFARAQAAKFRGLTQEEPDERDGADIEDELEMRERQEEEADRFAEEQERAQIRESKRISRADSRRASGHHLQRDSRSSLQTKPTAHSSWKNRTTNLASNVVNKPTDALKRFTQPRARTNTENGTMTSKKAARTDDNGLAKDHTENGYSIAAAGNKAREQRRQRDLEAQQVAGDVLFSGFSDELEDLTPEERDSLVRYAFQHEALRARRPVVWIPRDPLGISDDEIARSKLMSTVEADGDGGGEGGEKGPGAGHGGSKTYIWMSNDGTALDGKGRVVFRKSPPDFASVDLIQL